MPIAPTPDPEPIPPSGGIPPPSGLQVILYPPGGNPKGRAFRGKDVLEARWRITRLSGYADATLRLYGLLSDHPGLVPDACIEIWAWDWALLTSVRLYRGYVLKAIGRTRTGETPPETRVTLYGFWARLSRQIALQRYIYAQPKEIATVFSDLLGRWADSVDIGVSYAVNPVTTGFEIEALDAYRMPLESALERLDTAASHQIVLGCDVNSGGVNRAYLRPFDTAPSLVAALPDPSNHIELIESGEDARQRANALYLRGGKAKYPNLFAAMTRTQDGATGTGNSAFQSPRLGGLGYGNLLVNGGFEDGLTGWTTAGAVEVKDTSDPQGPSFEGAKFLETDNSTSPEAVGQTVTTQVVGGNTYTVAFAARAETSAGTPPEGRVTLTFRNFGTFVSTHVISIGGGIPLTTEWQQSSVPVAFPPSANQFDFLVEAPVAVVDFGIMWDAFQVFDASAKFQEGWESAKTGGGIFQELDWAVESPTNPAGLPRRPFFGAYCVYVNVAAAAVGDACILRPRAEASAAVEGSPTLRLSIWSLSPQGATVTPARRLVIEERDKDGAVIGSVYYKELPSVSAFSDWTQEDFVRTVSEACRYVRAWLEFVEPGEIYVGAFQLRDVRSPASEFIEGEDYEVILRADDAALGLTPPVSTSITDLGLWPELLSEEAATTETDGQALGRAALQERALSQLRPRVVWVGSPTLPGSPLAPWPGMVVKAMGELGSAVLPMPYPIVEIEGAWQEETGGMLLRISASLVTDPENEARTLQKLLRKSRSIG